ncbi:hypothetical protein L6452_32718 [Arctium lappa]|uniref:Uncharacterized protein n=1 Tax=Arctium lappa TaxID=4217 RepID=A0ACB8Z5L3_ARCLA|nr:hypothetical protein L6452_32718 [Arctium lappa]
MKEEFVYIVEERHSIKNRRIQRAGRDKETEKLKLYGFTKTFSRETKKEIIEVVLMIQECYYLNWKFVVTSTG